MTTGSVKFAKVISSAAEVAVPLNHFNPTALDVKIAMKITPDTYSGVAVVAMEKVDKPRSNRLPSRIPAAIPTTSASGTINKKVNSISHPVRERRRLITSDTPSCETVENPKSP